MAGVENGFGIRFEPAMNLTVETAPSASISLELPFDFQPLPGRTRELLSLPFALPHGSNEQSARSGAPESAAWDVLTAAFGVLLARYSGQPAISLSRARANEGAELGSPQLLRLEIGATCTCTEILEQTRARSRTQQLAAHPASLLPAPVGGRAAIVWFESAPGAAHESDPIERLVRSEHDADLTLVISSHAEGRAAFLYDSSLFRRSSVERLAGHLGVLLSHFGSNPGARVSELPLLHALEQRWLESICDGRAYDLPSELAHELVSQQAAAAPRATALKFRAQILSYGELELRSNQLARYLIERQIGAGCRVVVCVEPAFDVVIALLGVLKAGAAYVPLDPGYPSARIHAILADTRPALVITQQHLQSRLDLGDAATLVLDTLPVAPGSATVQEPRPAIDPGQTAYIYYTSGTTGSPKGVMASHANLSHYVRTAQRRYQIDARDVIPAIARFSFSISMFELLSPLIAGGTLLLLEREHILDPARLARTLSEVTFFHAGPSLLKGLVAYLASQPENFRDFSRVRHASSGGDMVPAELLERMKEIFYNAEVFVIYGASEISCMGCTYPVPRTQRITTSYVGKPFDNMVVRVLDGAQQVLPAGIVGELYFAGAGVTLGYLNRPELTAEKFITIDQRRFYRTGDRGRLSPEGWLEILGRTDFQVKLRGMRVELAEVEHHLRAAPGVRDAVAAAQETPDGEKTLVAYLITERDGVGSGGSPSARIAAVRQHMASQLPDYMLPSTYVELERLPLNHNLKLDRQALPSLRALRGNAEPLEVNRGAETASVRAPRTSTERVLVSLWQKLLGLEQVGLDDNFFELGGHSMLAVMLNLELERALGIRLEGIDILREPLAVLAAICERRLGSASSPATGAAPPVPARSAASALDIFHFGEGQSLYGVLHGSTRGARQAALICGALGQEQVRARFVLCRLAKQLARDGVPTLMFDYFGCGDSLGDRSEANFTRWRADIAAAHAELQRRSSGARITAIGVRLGASLLCQVAPQLSLQQLLLWDPVLDGSTHHAELAAMHRSYLRGSAPFGFWRRRAREPHHELLGTSYSVTAVRELKALALAPWLPQQRAPIRSLQTSQPAQGQPPPVAHDAHDGYVVERLAYDCGWPDIARLEDIIPDVRLSSTLAAWVQEGR